MERYKMYWYLDPFKDENENWVAGETVCEMKTQLLLPKNASDEEIFNMLDKVGYYIDMLDFYRKQDDIEVIGKEDGVPLMKLHRV